VSTPAFARALATALGQPARLAVVPVPLLRFAGRLLGRRSAVDRATGTLEVDPTSFLEATGWQPARTLVDECAAIAKARPL
jgi:UDP-glucose 4-epimerase